MKAKLERLIKAAENAKRGAGSVLDASGLHRIETEVDTAVAAVRKLFEVSDEVFCCRKFEQWYKTLYIVNEDDGSYSITVKPLVSATEEEETTETILFCFFCGASRAVLKD